MPIGHTFKEVSENLKQPEKGDRKWNMYTDDRVGCIRQWRKIWEGQELN